MTPKRLRIQACFPMTRCGRGGPATMARLPCWHCANCSTKHRTSPLMSASWPCACNPSPSPAKHNLTLRFRWMPRPTARPHQQQATLCVKQRSRHHSPHLNAMVLTPHHGIHTQVKTPIQLPAPRPRRPAIKPTPMRARLVRHRRHQRPMCAQPNLARTPPARQHGLSTLTRSGHFPSSRRCKPHTAAFSS